MMVGVLLSLLSIAAMLVVYKNMIESSGNAARAAQRDGQVASALLAAQIDLQQAGFGIASSAPLSSRLSISDDGRQLAWRYRSALGGTDQCAGLRLVDSADQTLPRGLYRLLPQACGDAAAATWSNAQSQAIASESAFFEPLQRDGSSHAAGDRETGALSLQPSTAVTGYRFHSASATCLPFQQQDDLTQVVQRVELRQSEEDVLFSTCLPNLATDTP